MIKEHVKLKTADMTVQSKNGEKDNDDKDV